jgi:cob(I)alamin adenosyltransferase
MSEVQQGLIHLYWGSGKGKTTAAMGLALRALGYGRRVVIVQFLKGTPSGEIPVLRQLGAVIYRGEGGQKFVFQMNEQEKRQTRALQTENLRQALNEPADLLILDEACAAYQLDMVERPLLKRAVLQKPAAQEVVLTGREPADWMRQTADYSTEMHCWRHPYEKGLAARKGIEF